MHKPLHAHLAKAYGAHPFDYILDTIGTQELFVHCPAYLKPHGLLVNVGNFEGAGIIIWRTIVNSYLPLIFGGVPRKYLMISTTPNGDKAAGLARMVEEGKLRVVVDEVFEFEDVLRVSAPGADSYHDEANI
jgi:NADPH:quinone reductase-like Zn-dependent oxidoreductase